MQHRVYIAALASVGPAAEALDAAEHSCMQEYAVVQKRLEDQSLLMCIGIPAHHPCGVLRL